MNSEYQAFGGGPPPQQYQMDPFKSGSYPPPSYDHPQNPHQPGPPDPMPPLNYGEKATFEDTFKIEKPKWNDLWAGILFIAVSLGFAAVSALSINSYSMSKTKFGKEAFQSDKRFGVGSHTIILFATVLGTATLLSQIYLSVARSFPKQFIWITGILNIILGFLTALYMLSRRYWSGGIVFLIFSVFTVIAFISWIPRIPFSALLLKTSVNISKKVGHAYIVSWVGGLIAMALGAWYSITLVSIYTKYDPGNNPNCARDPRRCSSGTLIGLLVFVTFAMFWISEWLKDTVHTTVSGIYGSWYFCSRSLPKGVTRGALKRSLTYGFGSISMGSLIVAIVHGMRHLCSIAQGNAASDGNILGSICFCFLGCLIGILEWMVQFLNRYAFVHIALYGKPYIQAAKDTWMMIKNRGVDALINECLISPVFAMGSVFVGFVSALLGYLFILFTHPKYNANGSYTPVVVAFSFLIGFQICSVVTTPIVSGVETIFVAMAWDPQVMQRDHPELWHSIIAVYPQLQNALHA